MARRKTTPRTRGIGVVVAAVLLAVLYASNFFSNDAAEQTPTIDTAEISTADTLRHTAAAKSVSPSRRKASPSSSRGQRRARGMEIPAYLTDRPEEIVLHTDFTLSYNNKHLVPNWVAWVLTPTRTNGSEKRANDFQPDTSIKRGPIAQDSDYRRSGYDRGHMCPSADNKHSRAAMNECFLLSNICPQNHTLNAGDWERLETLCRQWAAAYDSIYIVCGPIIDREETYATIGANKVMVPRQFYKVVFRWTGEKSAEAIGFIFNNDAAKHPLTYYAVSVDSVEARTGINFFSKVPRSVQRKAEATFDCSRWANLVR